MVAFMSFFFALFLRATDHQVPWLALAAVVGAASTALVRIVLLPERPGPDLRRLLTATRGHTAVVTQRTAELLEHAGAISDNRLRRLRRAVRELDAVALLVEQQLTGEYAERLVDDPEQVRGLVFDVEMAAQHFARAVGQDADKLPEVAIRELSEASRRLAHVLRISHPAPGQEALTAIAPREPGDWRQPEHHVRAALARLAGELDALASINVRRHPAPAMPGRSDGPDDAAATSPNDAAVSAPDDAAPPDGRGLRERLSPTDRTAVQVLVAGSLAIAVGQAISMQRWYWAVIGTFVVFTNTQTGRTPCVEPARASWEPHSALWRASRSGSGSAVTPALSWLSSSCWSSQHSGCCRSPTRPWSCASPSCSRCSTLCSGRSAVTSPCAPGRDDPRRRRHRWGGCSADPPELGARRL